MPNWLVEMRPEWVAALSTVLLAFFALVQIGREAYRGWREARMARIWARGPAWLARRNLEAMLAAARSTDAFNWVRNARHATRPDLEEQMLAVVRLAGQAGGASARSANKALEAFLAYEGSIGAYNEVPTERDGYGGTTYSAADEERRHAHARDATEHLRAAIAALCELAPRQDGEPHPPSADQILTR